MRVRAAQFQLKLPIEEHPNEPRRKPHTKCDCPVMGSGARVAVADRAHETRSNADGGAAGRLEPETSHSRQPNAAMRPCRGVA